MTKKLIYLSMPYRGSLGDSASSRDIEANVEKAVAIATEIKRHFPCANVLVPHLVKGQMYVDCWAGRITNEQIFEKCCQDVETCDLLVAVGDISAGMELEINTAIAKPIPVLLFKEFNMNEQDTLAQTLKSIGAYDDNQE